MLYLCRVHFHHGKKGRQLIKQKIGSGDSIYQADRRANSESPCLYAIVMKKSVYSNFNICAGSISTRYNLVFHRDI